MKRNKQNTRRKQDTTAITSKEGLIEALLDARQLAGVSGGNEVDPRLCQICEICTTRSVQPSAR